MKSNCERSRCFLIVGVMLFVFNACGSRGGAASVPSGSAEVSVMALSAGDVASVTVTITGDGIVTPIVVALVSTAGTWAGTIGHIPAGLNRTFTLSAVDAMGTEAYHGMVSGVTITAGQSTTVVITAQQVAPPLLYNNAAPVIDGLVVSAVTVAPGSGMSLAVTAHDPNPGDTLSYTWSAEAGTFASPSDPSTNWTAPATAGTVHITIDVRDQLNAHATMSLDILVAGQEQGSARITVVLNTWPVVTDVTADPTRADAGQTVVLNVVATDSDGDTLSFFWASDCLGTFSDTSVQSPSFTLMAVPTSKACTFTVKVEDGKGGSDKGSIAIAAGPPPSIALSPPGGAPPPVIVSTYQSADGATAGQTVTMSVQAVDPSDPALSFTWTTNQGTLGQPNTAGGTSGIVWTAPTPFTTSATIQVTITDALGQAIVQAFAVNNIAGGVVDGGSADVGPVSPPDALANTAPLAVSAGGQHTCALRADNSVACWGLNKDGQSSPPDGTFVQISAGGSHTCGLRADGIVACWGDNNAGESNPPSGRFTQVSAGGFAPAGPWMSMGPGHTCGVKTDGTIACWGDNTLGQSSPQVGTFAQVSAGGSHTCAVETDGSILCWGAGTSNTGVYPHYGQSSPPDGTFTQVNAGDLHTCGIRTDATVVCWGINSDEPTYAPPTGNFIQVSAGSSHTCGLRTDGSVACWGDNGCTGDPQRPCYGQSTPPTSVFAQISAGGLHTCGLTTSGSVVCWGYDGYGQCTTPTAAFAQVSTGCPPSSGIWGWPAGCHTCGVDTGGGARCWGNNDSGQSNPPVGTFNKITAGSDFTCAFKTGGAVTCWGNNYYGQSSPPASQFAQIASGGQWNSCGVMTDGTAACWGYSYITPEPRHPYLPGGTFIFVDSLCGVRSDGTMACWDGNSTPLDGAYKQVSTSVPFQGGRLCGIKTDGSVACSWTSTPPAGTFAQVSVGFGPDGPPDLVTAFACGITTEGIVACWGYNNHGQSTPPAGKFTQVSVADSYACAVSVDNRLWCWGVIARQPL